MTTLNLPTQTHSSQATPTLPTAPHSAQPDRRQNIAPLSVLIVEGLDAPVSPKPSRKIFAEVRKRITA